MSLYQVAPQAGQTYVNPSKIAKRVVRLPWWRARTTQPPSKSAVLRFAQLSVIKIASFYDHRHNVQPDQTTSFDLLLISLFDTYHTSFAILYHAKNNLFA